MAASMTLDELVALNDEIAGLVRAGIPLELGLAGCVRTGQGLLARARSALNSSRKDEAREALKLVSVEFGSVECGREAAELLKKLEEDRK